MGIKCKECQSSKVRSFDNEILEHKELEVHQIEKYAQQYDNEVYIAFICDACNHTFTISFDIVPKTKDITLERSFMIEKLIKVSKETFVISFYNDNEPVIIYSDPAMVKKITIVNTINVLVEEYEYGELIKEYSVPYEDLSDDEITLIYQRVISLDRYNKYIL